MHAKRRAFRIGHKRRPPSRMAHQQEEATDDGEKRTRGLDLLSGDAQKHRPDCVGLERRIRSHMGPRHRQERASRARSHPRRRLRQ